MLNLLINIQLDLAEVKLLFSLHQGVAKLIAAGSICYFGGQAAINFTTPWCLSLSKQLANVLINLLYGVWATEKPSSGLRQSLISSNKIPLKSWYRINYYPVAMYASYHAFV
jgi:hypothetical protein